MNPARRTNSRPDHLTRRAAAYIRATGDDTMHGFVRWFGERVREWRLETGQRGMLTAAEHDAFDRWLEGRVP